LRTIEPDFVRTAFNPGCAGIGIPTCDASVLVLDNDPHLIDMGPILTGKGYRLRTHTELGDLLTAGMPSSASCLLLGNRLTNGMTGLTTLAELQRHSWNLPTVLLAKDWTVQLVVSAMKAGAAGFLAKPCAPDELLAAVDHALDRARSIQNEDHSKSEALARVASLNPREASILRLVLSGLLNKEIADRLNLALITVKVYRGRAMKKLGASNPAELARIASLGGVEVNA
jgi:FixJ family two-component response regulator